MGRGPLAEVGREITGELGDPDGGRWTVTPSMWHAGADLNADRPPTDQPGRAAPTRPPCVEAVIHLKAGTLYVFTARQDAVLTWTAHPVLFVPFIGCRDCT